MGVFYIESPATRQLLAKAGVVDFEHIVIYSSIIRPAANRFINMMLSRIHGQNWELLHSDLDFLKESYGIMVYEEQVTMAAMVMAGLNYADADLLRKSLSRKSMTHIIESWKEKFTKGAISRGYSINVIEKIWAMILSFSGYSFVNLILLPMRCYPLPVHI